MVGVEQWAEIRRMHRVERCLDPGDQSADGVASQDGPRGRWRRRSRRGTRGRAAGRSWIRSRTGSVSSWRRIRGSSRSGCGRWPASWAMRAGSRSLMTTSARSGRGSWRRGRFSGRSIGRVSWSSAICGSRASTIPVGHGQRRRGWVVTCEVCWSRAIAGTLIFSKEAPDILWGLARNLQPAGGVAGEAGVGSRGGDRRGRPPDRAVRRVLRPARGRLGDPRGRAIRRRRARSSARIGSCARTSSRAACSRTTSTSRTGSTRGPRRPTGGCIARSARSRPSGWPRSRRGCGRCRRGCRTSTAARSLRVPAQPFVRVDRNDYSIDPRVRRSPRRGPRLPDRDHRGRAGHRRARRPAPAGVRRRADDHRPGASDPA